MVSSVQEGFGNVLATSGSLTTNNLSDEALALSDYHLTTKEQEPETALYYFYARWYDPVVGRFITKDPKNAGCASNPLSFNKYTYTENNPMFKIDPTGTISWEDVYKYIELAHTAKKCADAIKNWRDNAWKKREMEKYCENGEEKEREKPGTGGPCTEWSKTGDQNKCAECCQATVNMLVDCEYVGAYQFAIDCVMECTK